MKKNLWGGRFQGATDPGFAAFSRSFAFDQRLLAVDIRASRAHARALAAAAVLTQDELKTIETGLSEVLKRSQADPNYLHDSQIEDVHSFVEARLIELVGDLGRKLHTGRSRNDQVATDFRLWLREAIDELVDKVTDTQRSLLEFAESNEPVVLPGYTHLQRAQPVLLAHWCLAYFEMLVRDGERLADARKRVNILPLGAAALAGTSFQINREAVARDLEFDSPARNSLDAVSDRDFCVEVVSACALIMMHLSRLAEDIILYATTEFGFFELSDSVSTGSSLMPQKKNPDSLELVRGKAGRLFGNLQALLVMLKGLPLAYNRDMQEDKEAVFDSIETTRSSLEVAATVLRNIQVQLPRLEEAALQGYLNATEFADYLVRQGVPFREAHEIVGRVVLHAISRGVELQELPLSELRQFSKLIDDQVFSALTLEQTLATKSQIGGTSRARVAEALAQARIRLPTN